VLALLAVSFVAAAVTVAMMATAVPLQNIIRVQTSEFQLKSILLFCFNHQTKSSNDQIFPLVLPFTL
jgi:hypothetical protein